MSPKDTNASEEPQRRTSNRPSVIKKFMGLSSRKKLSDASEPTSDRKSSGKRRMGRSKSVDDGNAVQDLETIAIELERMARALGKVEDPEKILLKHMKKESPEAA